MDPEAPGGGDRRDDRKRRRHKEKLRKRRCGRRSKGRRKARKAEKPQRKLKGRPGRRPGKNPCGRNAAEKFFCWIHPVLSGINGLFSLALKARDEARALYGNATLLWTIVLGLLCRRTTRNKMDGDRNDPAYAPNLMRLSMQRGWVDGEEKTAPCTQLVFNWLKKAKMRYLDILLAEVFRSFVEAKLLEKALFCGCFVVVLDGTKVDERVVPVGRAARRGRFAPPFRCQDGGFPSQFRRHIHPFRAVILRCGTTNFGKRDVYCRKLFTMRQHDLHVLHVLHG